MAKGGNRQGSGRPKGAHNKDKQELIDMINVKYPDYHPLLALADIANDSDNDKNLQFQASKEICKYIVPQLKSIDHSFVDKLNITVRVNGRKL